MVYLYPSREQAAFEMVQACYWLGKDFSITDLISTDFYLDFTVQDYPFTGFDTSVLDSHALNLLECSGLAGSRFMDSERTILNRYTSLVHANDLTAAKNTFDYYRIHWGPAY